jgi:hypothetical protein
MRQIAWTSIFLLAMGTAAACGGDDDDGVDGGPADGSAGATPTCAEYCSRITTNCTAENAQFTDSAECMSYCTAQGWDVGTDSADQTGDTLGCRQYHAGAAGSTAMPDVHCPHAGPTGGMVCGDVCAVYCDNVEANCADAALYPDRATCETACAAMTPGTPADTMGDTAYCRVYHSGVPAFLDSALHCPHAAEDPAAQCI